MQDSDSAVPEFLTRLGLAPPCSVEDVKQAYRDKVKAAHPDAGGSATEFQLVHEAFERALEWATFRAGRMSWLSKHVEQYSAQQELVSELESHGGKIEIEQVDWLKRSFGADFAQLVERVTGLRLCGPEFGDDTVALLLSERKSLEGLHRLDLSGSRLTDRGAALLANFQNLRRLDLRKTTLSGQALQLVEVLEKLEWIGLPQSALGMGTRLRLGWKHPSLHVADATETF